MRGIESGMLADEVSIRKKRDTGGLSDSFRSSIWAAEVWLERHCLRASCERREIGARQREQRCPVLFASPIICATSLATVFGSCKGSRKPARDQDLAGLDVHFLLKYPESGVPPSGRKRDGSTFVENEPELRVLIFQEHDPMRNPAGQRSARMRRSTPRGEIGQLRRENELLREEVMQLNAAVSIFRDVAQKLCAMTRTAEEVARDWPILKPIGSLEAVASRHLASALPINTGPHSATAGPFPVLTS